MRSLIHIKAQTELIHRYPNAPEEVSFLQEWHRHTLHVEVETHVYHDNRDVEFFMFQRVVREKLALMELTKVCKSCEMIAKDLILALQQDRPGEYLVRVFEDGECGGIVHTDNFY